MIKYPISFHTTAEAKPGIQTAWDLTNQDFKSQCAIPPEFEGPGGALSPEDLFAQALTNCFVATFKVYAEKSKLEFKDLRVQSELVVDLDDEKKPVMKRCQLNATISGAKNPDRIKMIAERAFKSGFILNSVKTETHFNLNLTEN
jgi:organic hydroperoxide reductase OsmC/OhrA